MRPTENERQKFLQGEAELYEKYPDCPRPHVISCLSLITTLDYAIEILCGRRKFEWRKASEYYTNRLCETKYFDYYDAHQNDAIFVELSQYATYLHDVEMIRFHDYDAEWYLDVSVVGVCDTFATMENARNFVEEFNCYDLDEEAAWCAAHRAKGDETEYFAFELGEVLDTNLDDLPEDRKKTRKKKQ